MPAVHLLGNHTEEGLPPSSSSSSSSSSNPHSSNPRSPPSHSPPLGSPSPLSLLPFSPPSAFAPPPSPLQPFQNPRSSAPSPSQSPPLPPITSLFGKGAPFFAPPELIQSGSPRHHLFELFEQLEGPPFRAFESLPPPSLSFDILGRGRGDFGEEDPLSVHQGPREMEYIPKISQVILKSRVEPGLSLSYGKQLIWGEREDVFDADGNQLFTQAWKGTSIMTIDILVNEFDSQTLVERWTLNFEPCGKREFQILGLEDISNEEKTEFVILIQSLYGHIRSMPLSELLSQRDLERKQISFVTSYQSGPSAPHKSPSGGSFMNSKDIRSHSFNTAEMSFGTFTLSVRFLSLPELSNHFSLSDQKQDPFASHKSPEEVTFPSKDLCDFEDFELEFEHQLKLGLSNEIDRSLSREQREEEEEEEENGRPEVRGIPIQAKGRGTSLSDRRAKKISIDTRQTGEHSSPIPSPKTQRNMLSLIHDKYSKDKVHSRLSGEERQTSSQGFSFGNLENGSNPSPIWIGVQNRLKSEEEDEEQSTSQFHWKPSPRPSASWSRSKDPSARELFGSLLGSYEESIMNGRMSTSPSKPIEFLAEIGVFGQGKCKSSLKCPPHVNFNFQSYFYQMRESDSPSPYVGTIDLRRNLAEEAEMKHPGFYRLPPKGLLQVIIKNPNKTVVKIYLVPYDLSDMPIGTKTFMRQISHSAESNNFRYGVHLKFVNQKKRIYLHHSVRVVFSHRVPDGSEKLKTITKKSEEYIPLASPGQMLAEDED